MSTHYITRNEAALLSGASATSVNKAVEQKAVRLRSRRRGAGSVRTPASLLIDARDAGALRLFSSTPIALPVREKRRVFAWLREADLDAEMSIAEGIVVRKTKIVEEATRRAVDYAEMRERFVEVNPDVQRGEPVIRGTRVTVRGLARQIAAGEEPSVLLAEYDYIDPEAFDFAVLWAAANPRRGRPIRSAQAPSTGSARSIRRVQPAKRRAVS